MSLRSVNFNLIPVLRALLRERSVSRAADQLGLTQSGASAALSRLRAALDDPLLVPVGRGLELTRRARDLIEPVEQLCAMMDSLLKPPDFDPAVLERNFVVNTADFVAFHVAARILPKLILLSPAANLQFIAPTQPFKEQLRRGEADLAIMPSVVLDQLDHTTFRTQPLFRDDYVAVVGVGHRLAGIEEPTAADLEHERHLIYHSGRNSDPERLHLLSGSPAGVRIMGRFHQLSLLPLLALETDCVAIAPRSFAEYVARWLPLRILNVPNDRVELDLHMVWSTMHDQDPAHRWLRGVLVESMSAD